MADFFNSQASNYLVSLASKVSKTEKEIVKDYDSESLLDLYQSIQDASNIIDSSIARILEKKKLLKEEE